MKLYDLSYSYFFLILLNFKGFFEGIDKIAKLLVAVGLNGTSVLDPRLLQPF